MYGGVDGGGGALRREFLGRRQLLFFGGRLFWLFRGYPDGLAGPVDEFGDAFEDFGRDFVVGHGQGFAFGFVREGGHAAVGIARGGGRVGFEEQAALVEDGEEVVARIDALGAEHGAGADVGEGAELIEHKGFEGVVGHGAMISSGGWGAKV